MATEKTTTLRIPSSLRDEIARIASQRRTTMLEVVTDAVHRLDRDEWWNAVDDALDSWAPHNVSTYAAETQPFDRASGDGLRGD